MKNFFERSEAQKGLCGVSAGVNSSECLPKSIAITSPSLPLCAISVDLRASVVKDILRRFHHSHRGRTEVHRGSLLSSNSANSRQRDRKSTRLNSSHTVI